MNFRRLVDVAGSLRLTVALLAASVPLILAATLDQVELGLPVTLSKYFHSVIAAWHYPESWYGGSWLKWLSLPIPGGLLLGPLLFINLIAAPLRQGMPQMRRGGLLLIHGGLLILLIGQTATDLLQRDGYVWFEIGETRAFVTSFTRDEVYLIDQTDPAHDRVTAIDFEALQRADSNGLALPGGTFRIVPRVIAPHALLQAPGHGTPSVPLANRGLGFERGFQIMPTPVPTALNDRATPAAVVEIFAGTQSMGTWLISSVLDERFPPQRFEHAGRTYEVGLRATRSPLPFSLTLVDFQHDRYPGTNIPRNFSSRIRLVDPARSEDREVEIRMNQPLRHGGYSFYQSAFGTDSAGRPDRASRLHAVSNPSRWVPYIACSVITIGLLWHLGLALLNVRGRPATPPR